MIQSLTIQGFKSLQNLENLELGQVNVFVGSNGSGKSNLLEAIGFLSAAARGRIDDSELQRRGVRLSVAHNYLTSFAHLSASSPLGFHIRDDRFEYRASLQSPDEPSTGWKFIDEELLENGKELIRREDDGVTFSLRISTRTLPATFDLQSDVGMGRLIEMTGQAPKAAHVLFQRMGDFAVFAPMTHVMRGLITDTHPADPVGLLGGRLPDALKDILDSENETLGQLPLDEVFDLLDWVAGFDIVPPDNKLLSGNVPALRTVVRFRDRFMAEGRNQLTGYDASEGALYVLFLLTLALHPRVPIFFAVDNFDQCLNPRLARAVTRIFVREILASDPPRQVLLTTHSPQVLDGLDLTDDRVRLFAVERDSNGATQARRVQVSEEYLNRHKNGQALSTLWVSGVIGGVPDL
jgi:predicted ATPase